MSFADIIIIHHLNCRLCYAGRLFFSSSPSSRGSSVSSASRQERRPLQKCSSSSSSFSSSYPLSPAKEVYNGRSPARGFVLSLQRIMPSAHLIIKGKVQGVSYRFNARGVAQRLSLSGWIKNTPRGDVEAFATGPQEALQRFIDWCRQGPPGADVTDVLVHPAPEKSYPDFSIVR